MGEVNYEGDITIVTVRNPAYGTWVSEIHAKNAVVNGLTDGKILSNILNLVFIPWVSSVLSTVMSVTISVFLKKIIDDIIPKSVPKLTSFLFVLFLMTISFVLNHFALRTF